MTYWGKKTNRTFFTAAPPEYQIGLRLDETAYDPDWFDNDRLVGQFHWHGHKKLWTIQKFCRKHDLILLCVDHHVFRGGYIIKTETVYRHPDLPYR